MGTFYMSILCYEAMSACWCGLGSWFELPVTLPLSYNHKQLLHMRTYCTVCCINMLPQSYTRQLPSTCCLNCVKVNQKMVFINIMHA